VVPNEVGNPTYLNVEITETRPFSEVWLKISSQIGGVQHHSDWWRIESTKGYGYPKHIYLRGWGGRWNGSEYAGAFISNNNAYGSSGDPGQVRNFKPIGFGYVISNFDGRALTNVRLTASFYIAGKRHDDFELLGDLPASSFESYPRQKAPRAELVLNGNGGSWDSSKGYFAGNFLRAK
jgi:hypothetical protein